jgi:hypothetical protein
LEDFISLSWDGERHDATPTAEAPFDLADSKYLLDTDLTGAKRGRSLSGAVTR